jgi:hypothetical protein
MEEDFGGGQGLTMGLWSQGKKKITESRTWLLCTIFKLNYLK